MDNLNRRMVANLVAVLSAIGWFLFGLISSEGRLLEEFNSGIKFFLFIGVIFVALSWFMSHLGALILTNSKGALRLAIAISIVWFLMDATFVWMPQTKYSNFEEFIVTLIPIFIFWSCIWIVKGFLNDGDKLGPTTQQVTTFETDLDKFIKATYGNLSPKKTAVLDEAVALAYNDLLMQQIPIDTVQNLGKELIGSPIPYSTEDLALSISLKFYSSPEFKDKLEDTQLMARMKLMEWISSGKVNHHLAKAFEEKLYQQFKT